MNYFLVLNNQQSGPFPKEELIFKGLTPETLVWREGLANWTPAGQLEELLDLFVVEPVQVAPPQPVQPVQVVPEMVQPVAMPQPEYAEEPKSWKGWAIASTIVNFLFCGLFGAVLGIIGIVYSGKAQDLYAMGNTHQGDLAGNTAKIVTIISLVMAGITLLSSLIAFVMFVVLGMSLDSLLYYY